jgi:hypothetical protein
MTNQERMALIKAIYNLIFICKPQPFQQWQLAPKPAGYEPLITVWVPRTFVNGTVRGIDLDVNDNGKILQLRFMEQNMNKKDSLGNLKQTSIRANNGEFIMWVVDRKPNGGFLGSIQNGNWIASQMRAYAPVQYNAAGAIASHTEFESTNVPDIPYDTTVPDYVVMVHDDVNYTVNGEQWNSAEAIEIDTEDLMDGFDPDAYDETDIGDQDYDGPN